MEDAEGPGLAAGRKVASTLPPWAPRCHLPHNELIHLRDLAEGASCRLVGAFFFAWAPAVTAPPRVMAAARPSAYNAEFRVFILVLRRRRPVVWFPAGEVAGATRVVAFYRARGLAHPVPRKLNIASPA